MKKPCIPIQELVYEVVMRNFLTEAERIELRKQHKFEHERRYADRIKALLLWDAGWSLTQIAQALLLDESTIRRYRQIYQQQGINRLLDDDFQGSHSYLNAEQQQHLREHLREHIYQSTAEICEYVRRVFGVQYSNRGMSHLLKRLEFIYKKPKAIPGKADAEKQEAFVREYEKLIEEKRSQDPVYFVDGVHPQHNSKPSYGCFPKGEGRQIATNTGRKRLNLNGALNAQTHKVVIREDPTINAQSTITLFKQLEGQHPNAERIYVILDNARYYRSKLVKKYVKNSKIELRFLPAYAPNLNLIERVWRFFKKKALGNKYFESFVEFREACFEFFEDLPKLEKQLNSLLVDNFHIVRPIR